MLNIFSSALSSGFFVLTRVALLERGAGRFQRVPVVVQWFDHYLASVVTMMLLKYTDNIGGKAQLCVTLSIKRTPNTMHRL